MGLSAWPLRRYRRWRPESRTSTAPTSRRTRRCLDTCGWASPSSCTRSLTGRSPPARRSRISRRRGSATALNASAVVAARAIWHSYSHIGMCFQVRLPRIRRETSPGGARDVRRELRRRLAGGERDRDGRDRVARVVEHRAGDRREARRDEPVLLGVAVAPRRGEQRAQLGERGGAGVVAAAERRGGWGTARRPAAARARRASPARWRSGARGGGRRRRSPGRAGRARAPRSRTARRGRAAPRGERCGWWRRPAG